MCTILNFTVLIVKQLYKIMNVIILFLLQKVKFEEIRKNCSYIIIITYNYIRTSFSYFFQT